MDLINKLIILVYRIFGLVKKKTNDSISDLYLRSLYKLEKKNKPPKGLPEILDNNCIYYNSIIIDSIINNLLSIDYIEETEGINTYFFHKKGYHLGWFKKKPSKESLHEEILSNNLLDNIEGRINICKLTKNGNCFVQNKQYLDEEFLERKNKRREKFFEKLIDTILVIIVSIITTLITIYLTKNK